jgi:hypothetical protein
MIFSGRCSTIRQCHPQILLFLTNLPCVDECTSAPYSISTVSVVLSVNRQNSRSTSLSVTLTLPNVRCKLSPEDGPGRWVFHHENANAASRAWNDGIECSSPSSNPKSSPWENKQAEQNHSSFVGTAASGGSRQ